MTLPLAPEADAALKLAKEMGVVDTQEVRVLQQLFTNRVNEELISTIVSGKEGRLVAALYKVIVSSQTPAVVGYVLRFTFDLCMISNSFGQALANPDLDKSDAATKFLEISHVHAQVPGIHNPAMFLAATVLRFSAAPLTEPRLAAAKRFITMLQNAFSASVLVPDEIDYTIHAFSVVARRRELRPMLLEAGLVPQVARLLDEIAMGESAQITQILYETLLTAWLLSFDYGCMAELHKVKILPKVHRVMQRSQKDKIIRMSLMIIKNYTTAQRKYYHAQQSNEFVDPSIYLIGNNGKAPNYFTELIGIGTMKTLWQLARRKFGDEDIAVDVEELTGVLDQNMDAVTSFSEYRGEVQSGVLEWSPVHTSVKFWKENVLKFEENGYEVLRDLATLINTTRSELTLAVACHDVGEVVRYHPTGRMLLSVPQLAGLKERIMGLMSHSNPEVAKNALVAVQKILVQKWEFIN